MSKDLMGLISSVLKRYFLCEVTTLWPDETDGRVILVLLTAYQTSSMPAAKIDKIDKIARKLFNVREISVDKKEGFEHSETITCSTRKFGTDSVYQYFINLVLIAATFVCVNRRENEKQPGNLIELYRESLEPSQGM